MALKRAALAAAAALLAAGGAAAAEPGCPPTNPGVQVSLEDPEPSFHFDAGMEALRAESAAPGSAARRHLGVTTSRVRWQSKVEVRLMPGPRGFCARPERVSLAIRHAEHSVRIASELPRGGCLFRETETHERRHVAVNRATLRRAAGAVETTVRDWAASAVGRGDTERAAVAALQADLRRAIAAAMDAMRAERDAAHGRIDRPEEYRRLGQMCPDDQRALRERLRVRAPAAAD